MADLSASSTGQTSNPVSNGEKKYRGVRQRKWGRWVSEIRLPNSRERIWLGSYDSPEKAARAFDAASVCLRGPHGANLNFPDSPPQVSCSNLGHRIDPQEIQAAAASHANKVTQSPSTVSVSADVSNVRAEDMQQMDWGFMDTLLSPAGTRPIGFVEDFTYDHYFSLGQPAAVPEETDELSGAASNSFLWSF